jgi:hypothetical protein
MVPFSDRIRLAFVSWDKTARLWEAESGKLLAALSRWKRSLTRPVVGTLVSREGRQSFAFFSALFSVPKRPPEQT